jgi:hydrogenase maturation protein HypF
MPGGEQAIREPWRMALAHLVDAEIRPDLLNRLVPESALRLARQLLSRNIQCPLTSSAGRLFDAVAALAGVRVRASYEGQPAVELEGLAAREGPAGVYSLEMGREVDAGPILIDTRPLIAAISRDVARGIATSTIARRFHSTVAVMIVSVCRLLREESGLETVALSGGVFLNALLSEEVQSLLEADRFRVLRHHQVPPGDGGLCLGQLAVAASSPLAALR